MIKIAHESPLSIFDTVQSYTDIDYALVHLFEESEEYYDKFVEARHTKNREVILDNSIFELGKSFDPKKYSLWIKKLQPTWYIIPDVLESFGGTIRLLSQWNSGGYGTIPGKKIAVVQGRTYEEIVACYKYIVNYGDVDMIAISFDYSLYRKLFPHPNKFISWMMGRVLLLGRMYDEGIIDTSRKHHLLGCSLPQEGLFYKHSNYNWIYSVDTSNPIVHGLKGIPYSDQGLWKKESTKLVELIYEQEPENNLYLENLQAFRSFWNSSNNNFIKHD